MTNDRMILTEIARHHRWANLRLIDACRELPDEVLEASAPGTYGTLRDTLHHMAFAEEGYVTSLTGHPPAEPLAEHAGVRPVQLRSHLDASGQRLIQVAEANDGDRVLNGTYRGRPFSIRASVLLIHALDHASEHRTHVRVIMSQQKVEPPLIDGMTFGRGV